MKHGISKGVALVKWVNEQSEPWGWAKLAEAFELNQRTAQRWCAHLVEAGVTEYVQFPGPSTPALYKVAA